MADLAFGHLRRTTNLDREKSVTSRVRRRRRTLTNAQVWEAVAAFMATGNAGYLPLEFRREAEGIRQLLLAVAAAGPPPMPPGLGRPFSENVRAVLGDRADVDSGLSS